MVHKKSELSTNSTIECLLPPIPSVPQILFENLKYEEEMKKKEKLHNRKKRKNSTTSTKFLPDWINDVQCDWAHSHDFRNYSKKSHKYPTRHSTKSRKNSHKKSNSYDDIPSIQSSFPQTIHHNKSNSLSNGKYNRKQFDSMMDDMEIKKNTLNINALNINTLEPSETSPAFESPALSPDEPEHAETSPPDLSLHHEDNNEDNYQKRRGAIHSKYTNYKTRGATNNGSLSLHIKTQSISSSTSTALSPKSVLSPLNETSLSSHKNESSLSSHKNRKLMRSHGARSRSVSATDSVGSDYNDPFEPSLHSSLSHSESMPIDNHPDLTKEVTQHLEKFNIDSIQNKTTRSDSMLPSELKKRYKTKIKQIGKSIKIEDVFSRKGIDGKDKNKKSAKKKIARKWRRKKNKNKNIKHPSSAPVNKVIDEDHEIDNNYFNTEIPARTVMMTPSREYSTSTSRDENSDNEMASNNDKNNENENVFLEKIIKSDDEKTLQEMQSVAVQQPKKPNRSGGMFSRLFSKIQTWTDKNRQAFTSYSQILKTAITQQV